MRIAVTGASGFIGRTLCPALVAAGHEVVGSDAEAVVHLAGIAHRRASRRLLKEVNVDLPMRIGLQAGSAGARMIFMSSVKVHGEESHLPFTEESPVAPGDAYAESKATAERALRAIPGLPLTVLRPPLVYGPGVKANFFSLMRAVARGWPLPFSLIENRRSLVYVGNVADAVVRCLASPTTIGKTYLLSDGPPVSTPQLCRALGEALGRPARLFPVAPPFLPLKLGGSLEVDDKRIRQELGWSPPFSFQEGLRRTAEWYLGG